MKNNFIASCKTLWLLLLCFMFFFPILSQNVKISGTITDAKSGEVLINVFVSDRVSGRNCTTNKFGYYVFISNKQSFQAACSSIGYKPKQIKTVLHSDTVINIELDPIIYEIREITVGEKRLEEKIETGKLNIPVNTINSLPNLMGEPDVLKAYQLMPGVQVGNESNNGLYVRGGTPDQNLFLLDDIPLYNVNHLGGLFSVFDHSIIKNIDLYKGGFPARYGGRASSVIDIRTKDGNTQKIGGKLGLGLLTSKLFLEGPIKKEKSSFVASIRYSNLGIYSYLYNQFQHTPFTQGYMFYDITLKGNVKLSDYNRLYMSVFKGKDVMYYKQTGQTDASSQTSSSGYANTNWGNSAGSIRWLHILPNGYFNNLTLAYTRYSYSDMLKNTAKNVSENTESSDKFTMISSSNDVILKSDFEMAKEKINIKLGAGVGFHSYVPTTAKEELRTANNVQVTDIANNKRLWATDLSFYSELEYKIIGNLSANSGLRTGFYGVNNAFFPIVEPRLVLNYHFLPDFSLKSSYSRMIQQIHLLTSSGVGLPSDIWVPSTNQLKPESSNQASLSLTHSIQNKYEFIVDMYVKYLHSLIEYKEGVLLYDSSNNWEEKVETGGVGKVKGIELLVKKKSGKLTGWLGYTLSSNLRQFKNINKGNPYPYVYEQRHNFSFVGNYRLSDQWEMTGTWTFHSGNHITLPSARYTVYREFYNAEVTARPVDVYVYSEKNGYKMPDYHRLDIGFLYTQIKTQKSDIKWSFNIYNAYNRQNAYYLYYKEMPNGTLKLYQKTIFPFLFNIGYLRTF